MLCRHVQFHAVHGWRVTRVFISHKSEDADVAMWIHSWLGSFGVDAYVDKLDPLVDTAKGEDLGDYFRRQLQQCTHLMAVISGKTRESWWVPFEIGIATEREYPLATFVDQGYGYLKNPQLFGKNYDIPEYLRKWPYLQTESDLANYVRALRVTSMTTDFAESFGQRRSYTKDFYSTLRGYLRQ